jgi:alpha-L-rhamnosidase
VSGDTLLMRNAISSFNDSRLSMGLTQSRYPSNDLQIIPTFSLLWIAMVSDYHHLCGDQKFVKNMFPGILGVLKWYESRIDSTGMVGHTEWWNFVDWVRSQGWQAGVPPGVDNSHSSIVNLEFIYGLQKASEIFKSFNMKDESEYCSELADKTKSAVYRHCYDNGRGLISDSPEKKTFSQHANVLAVITNTYPTERLKQVMEKVLTEKDIAPCSYYFRFYLAEALEKAKMADRYTDILDPWENMLNIGLTTFAEEPDPTRSDCHAWSASPLYYFLSLICGIKPGEPGFKSVIIEPNLGKLKWIEGSMPHRLGDIKVSIKKDDKNNLSGSITLPENLPGILICNCKTIKLKAGINNF